MKISLDELRNVKGIGPKAMERVNDHLGSIKSQEDYLKMQVSITPPGELGLELNDIYAGESINMMRSYIPDGLVDLTVTSPPYDNLREYNGFSFDYKAMLDELFRVTKDGGVVVWVVGDATIDGSESGSSFKQALYAMEIGFNLHDTMIYRKNSYPFPDKTRYYQVFEYMFVLSKGGPSSTNILQQKTKYRKDTNEISTYRDKDGTTKDMKYEKGLEYRNKDNIWELNTGYMRSTLDKVAYEHPAIFPEKLAEDHILSWSNEGDVVFDPMCGSGTTCKMAKLNNRRFLGFDVSDEYVRIAKERIENVDVKY